jgi:hypothetical protein
MWIDSDLSVIECAICYMLFKVEILIVQIMLIHIATLISLSLLSSLSNIVCIHIDQNIVEQKQCSNV